MGINNFRQRRINRMSAAALAVGGIGAYVRNQRRINSKLAIKKKAGLSTRSRKRTGGSRTIVRRRRKTVRVLGSVEQREVAIRQRARTIPTRALAMMSLEPQWWRIQGISQFDTSTGFYCIGARRNITPVPNVQYLPVHVWDLTAVPQGVGAPASVGFALSQAGVANNSTFELNSTNAAGSTVANTQLIPENTQPSVPIAYRKTLHDYSHIKLNLYGVRRRATKWMVSVIQLTDEFGDFITGGVANVEKAKVYDYLARPLMFNNLNFGDPQTRVDFKVIKRFETIIDPITTDQVDGANAVPKIQTVNWFIKHNRMRLYDWRRNDTPALASDAVYDQETSTIEVRTDPKKRIYLVLQAMSPVNNQLAGISPTSAGADANSEPSYDCIIRQKHWYAG